MINLSTHFADKKEALKMGILGLADKHVRTGDRVELFRRVKKLSNICVNTNEYATKPIKAKRKPSSKSQKKADKVITLLEIVLISFATDSDKFGTLENFPSIDVNYCQSRLIIKNATNKRRYSTTSGKEAPRSAKRRRQIPVQLETVNIETNDSEINPLLADEDSMLEFPIDSLNSFPCIDVNNNTEALIYKKCRIWDANQIKEALTFDPTGLISSNLLDLSNCTITVQHIYGKPLNRNTSERSHFVNWNEDVGSVEDLALDWYSKTFNGNWKGVHCENSLWLTLYGICMWEAIFYPIEGVWWNEYQHSPSDLYTDEFVVHRKEIIQRLCNHIGSLKSNLEIMEYIATNYWRFYPQRCVGVNWSNWSVDILQDVAVSLGAPALAKLCEFLSNDYSHWTSGLPDLCLYRVDAEKMPCAFGADFCTCTRDNSIAHYDPSIAKSAHNNEIVISSDDDDEMEMIQLPKIQKSTRIDDGTANSIATLALESPLNAKCKICNLYSINLPSNAPKLRLVEVKGPRDRLSSQQMAWLYQLSSIVHVEVCLVRYE